MSKALINKDIIEWAQQRSGVEDTIIAASFSKPRADQWIDKIRSWKSGDAQPTLRQAQKLAKVLRIPFGYLYASKPPEERAGIPDLRTLLDAPPGEISNDFLDLLLDIQAKQEWFRDELLEAGRAGPDYVGKYDTTSDVMVVAREIRDCYGIDGKLRRQAASWQQFLTLACDQVEGAGTLVFRSGIVGNNTRRPLSVEEFRGFAIADDVAPLVFINSKDTTAAQTFTLIHEAAHIWIGSTGVSNAPLAETAKYSEESEIFCNKVAAEVLVPRAEILNVWRNDGDAESNAADAARIFRVSTIVILRRALDLHLIDRPTFFDAYNEQLRYYRTRESRVQPGGDFYRLIGTRNSKQLTRSLVSATMEGRVPIWDAASLLGIKAKTLRETATVLGFA